MRVLYLTSADFRLPHAPAARGRMLARALARLGHRVTVVAPGDRAALADPLFDGISFPCSSRPGLATLQIHAGLAVGAARVLAGGRAPHVVLMRETAYGLIGPLAAIVARAPLVIEVNNIALAEIRARGAGRAKQTALAACYSLCYRRAAALVALTEPIRRHLLDAWRMPAGRVETIPNAVDTSLRRPLDRAACRAAERVPAEARVIFYMGSFHPQQGISTLLPLARGLLGDAPPTLFILAGGGAGADAFQRAVGEAGLSASFRFVGRVNDERLNRLIGAADLCLNPAAPELAHMTDATFPQKLLEYLAGRRAVLSVGRSEQMRAVVEGAGTGRLVPPDADLNANLLAAARDLLADPARREAMAGRGFAYVLEHHTYERIARRFDALFQRLVAARRGGRSRG